MNDEAALLTRPDYPPSPTKFNCEVADAKLATAKAGTSRSKQKNMIHFFYHLTALSYTELNHCSLLLLSPSRKAVMIPIRILKIHLTLLISLVLSPNPVLLIPLAKPNMLRSPQTKGNHKRYLLNPWPAMQVPLLIQMLYAISSCQKVAIRSMLSLPSLGH